MEHEVEMQGGAGDPAQAFEDLRAEVSDMRRAVEAFPHTLAANQPPAPHDYRSDIGKVAQGLGAVVGRLNEIEKHPALRLTPEVYGQRIAAAGTSVMSEAGKDLATAIQAHDRATNALEGMIGTLQGKRNQLFWLISIPVLVFFVTLFSSPILLQKIPFGWNTRAAATVMNNDRWDAGMALMQIANPAGWQNVVDAWNLVRANQAALAACQEVAAKAGKDQRCTVIVKVPVGQ